MELLRIITRGSLLARTQTQWLADQLSAAHPGLVCELVICTTQGDRDQKTPLPQIGGKGLFTAELEQALLAGKADVAVHSLKDLPVEQPPGLQLGAVPAREQPLDALVLPAGCRPETNPSPLALLAPGAQVGTSSARRSAMLKHLRPDLSIEPLRGNLDTRLRRLEEGRHDAIVLAADGLARLGWQDRISALLPADQLTPAPGQGALAVQCRCDDKRVLALLSPVDHWATRVAVTAERAFLDALGGGCQVPVGALATAAGESLHLVGAVAHPDGSTLLRRDAVAPADQAAELGRGLAEALLREGADRLLFADG